MWVAQNLKALMNQLTGDRQPWLVEHQKQSLARFLKNGFPQKNQKAWRHTSTKFIEENTFKLPTLSDDIKQKPKINLADKFYDIVFLNGCYIEKFSAVKALAELGVSISSIAQLSDMDVTWIKKTVDQTDQLKIDDMPFYYLGQALLTGGVYVDVSRHVELKKPIRLLYLTTDEFSFHMQHTACHIRLQADSKIVFLEEFKEKNEDPCLNNHVTQITLKERSNLYYYNVQHCLAPAIHLHHLLVRQANASTYQHNDIAQGAMLARNDRRIYLEGENAKSSLNGVFSANAAHHIDHYIHINHSHMNTHSDQFYKGLAKDRAYAIFNSHVLVPKHIQGARASQLAQNLLLSNSATIDLSPTLEIYADDVQCSHGATIGNLDESALFYLCSRGIDREVAEALLQNGFLMQIVKLMPHKICQTLAAQLL
jgi:Fe-S cluster assembly protein SufD